MSSPIIWIIFPTILSIITFFLRRWISIVTISVTVVTIFLAILAWQIPIGEMVGIGPFTFTITDRIMFFGRQFILGNTDRSILLIIYFTLSFFFIGSIPAGVSNFFVPLGLAMSSLLIASLSVRPFLYSALFIEVAILMGVPMLSPPGNKIERSVLQYLSFLSFGFPFMLIGSGLLSTIDVEGINFEEILPALVILGFGFALLLAIFPLGNWIPLLIEQTHPYSSTFILAVLPIIVFALLLRYMRQFPWMIQFEIIELLGVLMVVTGGLWAAFQRNLGRLLGYAIIIEIGYSLLAVSQPLGLSLYFAMLPPRILAYGVWALSLSFIKELDINLSFRSAQGLGRQTPLIVLGVIIAHFSLSGFPLLASFPLLLALWGQLAITSSIVTLLVLLGSVGLLIGGLRSLAVFVMGPDEMGHIEYKISRISLLPLLLGILFIVFAGFFPQWSYIIVSRIIEF